MHTIPAPLQIYAYWAIAMLIGVIFFRKDVMTANNDFGPKRIGLIIFSVIILGLNAYIYSNSTTDGGRTLEPLSALIFSVGNGIAETFMFYAMMRLGNKLADTLSSDEWQLIPKQTNFFVGFLLFMAYSGVIHGLFWLNILPQHIVQTSPFKPFFFPIQLMIALSWALSFFWYRDIRTVFILHAIVDLTMIMNVKFSMFA